MPDFLELQDVLDLHELQLARYGGARGVRDQTLLQSAIEQARGTFDGAWLHETLYAMAAAYLFHIVGNHPFVDGNKRTGLLAALTFLEFNGVPVSADWRILFELTMSVARGEVGKTELADALMQLSDDPAGG